MDLWHEGAVDLGKIIPQVFEGEEIEEVETPVIPLVPEETPENEIPLTAIYGTIT